MDKGQLNEQIKLLLIALIYSECSLMLCSKEAFILGHQVMRLDLFQQLIQRKI